MIYIIHGQDLGKSRQALNDLVTKISTKNTLRLCPKNTSEEQVNLFLNATSLFSDPKLLILDNFFSTSKAIFDKVLPLILAPQDNYIVLYQDKNLTPTQLKPFSKAQIQTFKPSSLLWACLNSLKPGNQKQFVSLYQKMLSAEPYDLFLYILKADFRKKILQKSTVPTEKKIHTYLQLIELDYQNKTGQLPIPKELALQRVLQNFLT